MTLKYIAIGIIILCTIIFIRYKSESKKYAKKIKPCLHTKKDCTDCMAEKYCEHKNNSNYIVKTNY